MPEAGVHFVKLVLFVLLARTRWGFEAELERLEVIIPKLEIPPLGGHSEASRRQRGAGLSQPGSLLVWCQPMLMLLK